MGHRDKLINEMVELLYQHGITMDTIEAILRDFYKAHSLTKYSTLAIFHKALINGIVDKSVEEFFQRKKQ